MNSSNPLNNIPLSTLKGVGDKTEKLFKKVGVDNLNQLLHYYPKAYDHYTSPVEPFELCPGRRQAVLVRITKSAAVNRRGRVPVTVLQITGCASPTQAVWYNMPYLVSMLKKGSVFVLRGNIAKRGNQVVIEQPQIFTLAAYEEAADTIQPVYALTKGLSGKTIAKAVKQVTDKYRMVEYLPYELIEKYALVSRDEAVTGIHFPKNQETLLAARKRLVFDEFLLFRLGLYLLKRKNFDERNLHPMSRSEVTEKVICSLPYSLTGAQERAWKEIETDLTGKNVMHRLLEGDVGSGKTVLAFLAMLLSVQNGYQSALMVPTEVLARQHFQSFISLLKDTGIDNVRPALLLGSTPAKEKKEIYKGLSEGFLNVVIGTHALFQEKAVYKDLGLVITDEQHRFGVIQRESLSRKSDSPHILVMSATPIPRTLAMILYGNLDMSVLDEMPKNRIPVKNAVVDISYRKNAYRFIEKQVRAGHQAYVICPMVEPNEDFPVENVIEYAAMLKKVLPSDISVEILHGQMSAEEKNRVMDDFAAGRIDVLTATTVVEVGLDVKNATVMLIENADRFGLSQLHQLRGRVGRGGDPSYCIFVRSEGSDPENERLKIIGSSNDGFYIANEDLRVRGEGDIFGLRQSGDAGFLIADPFADAAVLSEAISAFNYITEKDPALSGSDTSALLSILNEEAEGIYL